MTSSPADPARPSDQEEAGSAGRSGRDFDIVLLGATGFAGGLTADYLATHAPTGLRWAIAGRSADKLAAVQQRLTELSPGTQVETVVVDVTDHAALADLAARTRVVATTVGPYVWYGEPVVAACAEAGTDYVDLTGEPEFIDGMYVAHHATAVSTGARLVHACGFDSVPHDLGAFFTVQQLPGDEPITLRGVVRAGGRISGGTFHSALTAMSRAQQTRSAAAARKRVEPRLEGRSSRAVSGRPHRDRLLHYWLLPMPTADPAVVARSGAALEQYGPRFRYSHYIGTRTLRYAAGTVAGVGTLAVASQVPPLRRALGERLQPGEGPSESRRRDSWFTVDFVGETPSQTVHTRVSGGDPGYDETAKMLAESAMCLAFDDNPEVAGNVTSAVAMGQNLLDRLTAAGIRMEVC